MDFAPNQSRPSILLCFFHILVSSRGENTNEKSYNFGTFLLPNLRYIISSSPCITHFLHHKLDFYSHNLDKSSPHLLNPFTVNQIPPKLSWPNEYRSLLMLTRTHSRIRSYTRHSKRFCHFMIFYSNPAPSADTLGFLLRLFVLQFFDNGFKLGPRYGGNNFFHGDNFYALHIARREQNVGDKIYTHCCLRGDHRSAILPNFGQLFLAGDSVTMCLHSPRMSSPNRQNFKCFQDFRDENLFPLFSVIQAQTAFRYDVYLPAVKVRQLRNGVDSLNELENAARYIVLHILAGRANANVSTSCLQDLEGCSFPMITTHESTSLWAAYVYKSTPVAVGAKNLHFLTCYSRSEVTFSTYTTPFDVYIWGAIAASIICVAVTAHGLVSLIHVIRRDDKVGINMKTLPDVTFRIMGILLDQIDGLAVKSGNYTELRVLLAVWVMVATVMTSSYKGLVILGLNAPPPSQYLDKFEVCKLV